MDLNLFFMNSVDFYTEVVGDVTSVSTNRSGRVSDSASTRKRGRVSDSEEVIVPFSYTDAVVLSRKHNVDMQLADGTMWSNYSWINDGHEVRLDMSVGGMDTEAREEVFRGSRSKYFKMDEALAETAAEYLLVQLIDDESDFYKEWMWKNPSKELFETVAKIVADVRGSESSAEDAAVALDQALPTSDSGYVRDSAEAAKIVGERVGKPVRKAHVKDAVDTPSFSKVKEILSQDTLFHKEDDTSDLYQGYYTLGSAGDLYVSVRPDAVTFACYAPNAGSPVDEVTVPFKDTATTALWDMINTAKSSRSLRGCLTFLKSAKVASVSNHGASRLSSRDHVSDASEEVVYDTLAEAFNKNGIDYSMEDYVLWSEQIKLDNHDQGDEAMLIVYAKSKDALGGDAARLDALYDEEGVDAFYAKADISTVGVQLFKKFGDYGVAPKEYTVTNPTKSQIDDIFDAVLFCHEEHCGYEEADAHLDEVFGPMNNASITGGE